VSYAELNKQLLAEVRRREHPCNPARDAARETARRWWRAQLMLAGDDFWTAGIGAIYRSWREYP
jgi:hypothetical protein